MPTSKDKYCVLCRAHGKLHYFRRSGKYIHVCIDCIERLAWEAIGEGGEQSADINR